MYVSICLASQTVAHLPIPNRHVQGQGHHRVPQPSKPNK